jgi:hypothetical protein
MSDTGLALYIDGLSTLLSRLCPWPEVIENTKEKRPGPEAADCAAIPNGNDASVAGGSRIIAKQGIVRPVDHADPRSLDHPSNREKWLELARALGRLEAREEYDLLHGHKERQSPRWHPRKQRS